MATLAATEMLEWLAQYQFLTAPQADELRPLMSGYADSHSFAKDLIRRDWLTPYQVNQLLQGKHEYLVLGAYRLRERLGEGAMGQIFKAWNLRLERIVAVKTIHKEYVSNPKAMDRFQREVHTASKLDHPNIALVRDADEVDGRPFLVMDYIDGFNLSHRVKKDGALPIHEAVEYARQAALGLQHAFERGVVHRDIKPSNLLVTTTRVNGESAPLVKILDFGLARFESESENSTRLTQVGNLLGTIDYVAPEQAQNARTADIRADIYSLGCSLFYMMTAQPPFGGTSVVEKIGPRLTGEAPSVRAVRSDVPAALDELLRKIMARRPDDRLQTPIEVAQALEPFAVKDPPKTTPPASVVVAQPVATAVVAAGVVPLAKPVQATPIADEPGAQEGDEKPERVEDPSFSAMTATGRDLSSGAKAAAPVQRASAFPLKLLILGGTGLAFFFVLCLALCIIWPYLGGDTGEKKEPGGLRIANAKFSMPSKKIKGGERKFVLVYIERTDDKGGIKGTIYKGPVRLSLEDLPDGVRADPVTIPPGSADREQIPFIVSNGTDPIITTIRVVAESEKKGHRAERTLELHVIK